MVRFPVLIFVSCAALVSIGLAVLPNSASAQGTAQQFSTAASAQATAQQFTTAITEVYGSTYPLTGRLDLELFPQGHLRGFYHTSYDKLYIPVVGGRDGNYIWFDIGPSSIDLGLGAGPQGKLHVVATMNNDGSFKGQVYPETAAVLTGLAMEYQLASPSPVSQNSGDQYVFSATPANDVEPTPHP